MSSSSADQQPEFVRLRDPYGPEWTVTKYLHLAKSISPHCPIGTQVVRLNILSDTLYQSCMKEGEARYRLKHLGRNIFGESSEVAHNAPSIYEVMLFIDFLGNKKLP